MQCRLHVRLRCYKPAQDSGGYVLCDRYSVGVTPTLMRLSRLDERYNMRVRRSDLRSTNMACIRKRRVAGMSQLKLSACTLTPPPVLRVPSLTKREAGCTGSSSERTSLSPPSNDQELNLLNRSSIMKDHLVCLDRCWSGETLPIRGSKSISRRDLHTQCVWHHYSRRCG